MALVVDLTVILEERRRVLEQVDQAIADIRRLLPPPKKQTRRPRQLRLPLADQAKKPKRNAPSIQGAGADRCL